MLIDPCIVVLPRLFQMLTMRLSLVLLTFNSAYAFECLQSLVVYSNENLGCH